MFTLTRGMDLAARLDHLGDVATLCLLDVKADRLAAAARFRRLATTISAECHDADDESCIQRLLTASPLASEDRRQHRLNPTPIAQSTPTTTPGGALADTRATIAKPSASNAKLHSEKRSTLVSRARVVSPDVLAGQKAQVRSDQSAGLHLVERDLLTSEHDDDAGERRDAERQQSVQRRRQALRVT
jgi:hypothetical protein